MPNLEEHCNDTHNRYGYDFRDIHKWMDEPSMISGSKHRIIRHDPFKTPQEAEKIFWDKVPVDQRQNIKHAVVDHIKLDIERTSLKIQNYHWETITNQMTTEFDQFVKWAEGRTDGKMGVTGDNVPQLLYEVLDKGTKMALNWHSFTKDLELNIEYKERLIEIQRIILNFLENQIYSIIYRSLKITFQNAFDDPNLEFSKKEKKAIKNFFKKWDWYENEAYIKEYNDYINLKNEIIKLDESGVLPEFSILLTRVEKLIKYDELKEKLQICYNKIIDEKEGVRYCPECRTRLYDDFLYCQGCGLKVLSDKK
jgi:hypothetical protein